MKYMWIIAAIFASIVMVFIFYPHLLNLVKCGLPKTRDLNCYKYNIIKSQEPKELQKAAFYNSFDIPDSLKEGMQQYKTNALLIVQDNEIIFEKYWNGFDSATVSNSFSAGKTVTGLLVGIALDKGYIKSLDQKVSDFLPNFDKGKDTLLTVEDLLTMSSGLKWSEKFNNIFSDVVKAYYTNNLKPLIKKTHVISTPGKIMEYQCVNSLLLGQIIEHTSGIPIAQFAQKYLWNKIGATHDAFWTTDKNGITRTFCCFYATARDYAKMGLLVLNNGKYIDGTYVLPDDYIQRMTSPNTFLKNKKGETVDYYGYQMWITHYKGYTIPYFRGMFGQYVFIVPGKNAVIVRLGDKRTEQMKNHTPIDAFIYLEAAFDILR